MSTTNFKNPYCRPWMVETGAASSGGGGKGLKGIVAGGITGGLEVLISYPTEYVKTHLQLDEKGGTKHYTGVVDCFRKTVKKHGVLGLYRGLSILLYGSIPKAGVRFGTFEKFKSYAEDEQGRMGPYARLLCGMGAGICEAIFAVTPMETVKVKFINDRRSAHPKYHGFFQGVRTIIKEEGLRGVYQGAVPTIIRQGSNQAVRFYVMETLKEWYKGPDQNRYVPKYLVGLFGALAGCASVFANTPVDVVKTRMQGLEAKKYKGFLDCFMKILTKEGFGALYKGTVPRLCRVCVDVAVTFMLYDSFMELFETIWP